MSSSTKAYWYSPDGKLYDVSLNHISFVKENPTLFDMTFDEIKALYRKYKEPYGFEGKARRDILQKALLAGWVRVRYYVTHSDGWTLEYCASKVSRTDLKHIMDILLDKGVAYYDDNIHVVTFAENKDTVTPVRREDFEFDTQTHEGGVLQFISSCRALVFKEHLSKTRIPFDSIVETFFPSEKESVAFYSGGSVVGRYLCITSDRVFIFTSTSEFLYSAPSPKEAIMQIRDLTKDDVLQWQQLNLSQFSQFI